MLSGGDPVENLSIDTEGFAAHGQNPQIRVGEHHSVRNVDDCIDDVLAVVQHQQHLARGYERSDSLCLGKIIWNLQAQGGSDGMRDGPTVRYRGELGDPDPVRELRKKLPRRLNSHVSLARASRASERDVAVRAEQPRRYSAASCRPTKDLVLMGRFELPLGLNVEAMTSR